MKKLFVLLLLSYSLEPAAQTLFHFGKDTVTADDFLRAYQKNNSGPRSEKAFLEYFDLYLTSRLKIAEAKRLGLDQLPQMKSDMQNLRQQLLPAYLVDKSAISQKAEEAFERSKKEIRIAHIFIGNESGKEEARKKAETVYAELKKAGKNIFSELAAKYSDDPAAKNNGGEIGWITVFSLPYEIENLVYNTPKGKTSGIFESKAGFHIIKNMEERKPSGRMKAAQVLLAFPPAATEEMKMGIKNRADSIYNRLKKGDDFTLMVQQFSNDVISSASNGMIPEFGIGDYHPAFEQAAFALSKDGDFSKPVLTPHGYHIIKRLERIPVEKNKTPEIIERYVQQVELSDRMEALKNEQHKSLVQKIKINGPHFNLNEVELFTKNRLENKPAATGVKIKDNSVLMSFSDPANTIKKDFTAADFIGYAEVFRFKSDGSGMKSFDVLWEDFMEESVRSFYENNLEVFNPAFRNQLQEFNDGNLFFEVMQKMVWGPSQTDTIEQLQFFAKNRNKYTWKPSADAVIFYASDATIANEFLKDLQKQPAEWSQFVTDHSMHVAADSGRFEFENLPGISKNIKEGMITAPVINDADKSATFAYIIKVYPNQTPRSFEEAKGLVISDFQDEKDKQWIEQLKQNYPVTVNRSLWESMLKEKKWK